MSDLQDYYSNLLIIQYHDLPKAKATIQALAETASGDEILSKLTDAFDLEMAFGKQLDLIGQIVGAERAGLDDDEYKVLLRFKIVINNSRGTMKDIDDAIYNSFGTSIVATNNQNMTMTYNIQPYFKNVVEQAYAQGILPIPIGVGVSVVLVVVDPTKIFGFKSGKKVTNAIGFSTKDETREATFLNKTNILTGDSNE